MFKVIATAITPILLTVVAPFGINEATPFGEALILIIIGVGTGAAAWWAQRNNRQD